MGGFVESPPAEEIAALARKKRVPFVEDLGSGAMIETETIAGLEHEPTPAEVIGRGVDLVCFSGDKLLGGPQAGVIAGKAKLIAALKRDPFFRALRCDKLILSALEATVDILYARASREFRCSRCCSVDRRTARARGKDQSALDGLPLKASVGEGQAQIGGGTLPRSVIASVTLDLGSQHAQAAGIRRPTAGAHFAGDRLHRARQTQARLAHDFPAAGCGIDRRDPRRVSLAEVENTHERPQSAQTRWNT